MTKQQNRTALAYLLAGIAVAGRALLAVPEGVGIMELSLTALALVGYLLRGQKALLALVCSVAQLVLECLLCSEGAAAMLGGALPALRAADLWLLLAAIACMLRAAGQPRPVMPLVAALPLTVYTVAVLLPAAAPAATVAFVVYSVALLWFTVLMVRAYHEAKAKK